jgi:hypothetical protein
MAFSWTSSAGNIAHFTQLMNQFGITVDDNQKAIQELNKRLLDTNKIKELAAKYDITYRQAEKRERYRQLADLKEEQKLIEERVEVFNKGVKTIESRREVEKLKDELRGVGTSIKALELPSQGFWSKLFNSTLGKIGLGALAIEPLREAISRQDAFNTALLAVNSTLEERQRLYLESREITQEFGVSQDKVVQAMEGFRHRGELYGESANSILKRMSASSKMLPSDIKDAVAASGQLIETFGAGTAEVEQTVQIAQNLGLKLRTVDDSIANIISHTGLNLTETLHLMTEISNMARGYGIKVAKPELDKITDAVAGLENGLRQVGASGGLAEKVFKNLTDINTRTGRMALFFGGGPGASANADQFTQTLGNIFGPGGIFARFSGQGLGAQYAFGQLAEQFGYTSVEARQLVEQQGKTQESAKALADAHLTIAERYAQQVAASGDALDKLKEKLMATSDIGLLPLTQKFQKLNETMFNAGFGVDSLGAKIAKLLGGSPTAEGAVAGAASIIPAAIETTAAGLILRSLIKRYLPKFASKTVGEAASDVAAAAGTAAKAVWPVAGPMSKAEMLEAASAGLGAGLTTAIVTAVLGGSAFIQWMATKKAMETPVDLDKTKKYTESEVVQMKLDRLNVPMPGMTFLPTFGTDLHDFAQGIQDSKATEKRNQEIQKVIMEQERNAPPVLQPTLSQSRADSDALQKALDDLVKLQKDNLSLSSKLSQEERQAATKRQKELNDNIALMSQIAEGVNIAVTSQFIAV